MRYFKRFFSKSIDQEWEWGLFFFSVVILGVFNFILATHSFPLSEGWWETYAYLDMHHHLLFKDIDIAFTPFFVYFNELLILLFGLNFFELRIFGVFSFLVLYVFVYFFLRKFVDGLIAVCASFIAAILFLSSDSFIAKDYHTYLHLFVVLSFFSFYKLVDETEKTLIASFLYALLLGVFVLIIVSIKQNTGVLLMVAYLIPLLFLRRYIALSTLLFVVIASIFVLVLSPLWENIWHLFSQNDSKGSLGRVLFAFLTGQNLLILIASTSSTLLVLLIFYMQSGEAERKVFSFRSELVFGELFPKWFDKVVIYVIAATLVLILFFLIHHSGMYLRVGFFIAMVSGLELYFIFGLLGVIPAKLPLAFFWPIFVLIYANTNTAYLDYIGQFENIAIFLALVLFYSHFLFISDKSRYYLRFFACAFAICILLVIGMKKYFSVYSWWIGGIYPYSDQKYTSIYPQLDGIKIDENVNNIQEKVHKFIRKYSESQHDVYFLNLPVFYLLENKIPTFRTVTQWFDVTTTRSIKKEFGLIQENPPNLAVLFFPQEAAYVAHANMKNQKKTFFQQRILNYFVNETKEGRYNFLSCNNIFSGRKGYIKRVIGFNSFLGRDDLEKHIKKYNQNNGFDFNVTNVDSGKYEIKGNIQDLIPMINDFGVINSPGFQSVCFFVKK